MVTKYGVIVSANGTDWMAQLIFGATAVMAGILTEKGITTRVHINTLLEYQMRKC